MTVRLNLGCGPWPTDGWDNVDIRPPVPGSGVLDGSIIVGDARRSGGLPYGDGTVAYAVANHMFQMVGYTDMAGTLAEVRRVLVAGGTFRIIVPDPLRAWMAYRDNDRAWFPIVDDAEPAIGGKLCAYTTWYGEARTVFTRAWLAELCVRAGFRRVAVAAPHLTLLGPSDIVGLDTRERESIVVEAQR